MQVFQAEQLEGKGVGGRWELYVNITKMNVFTQFYFVVLLCMLVHLHRLYNFAGSAFASCTAAAIALEMSSQDSFSKRAIGMP